MRVRERGDADEKSPSSRTIATELGRIAEPVGMSLPPDTRTTRHVAADREHMMNAGCRIGTHHPT